jgi:hypothetical protein
MNLVALEMNFLKRKRDNNLDLSTIFFILKKFLRGFVNVTMPQYKNSKREKSSREK